MNIILIVGLAVTLLISVAQSFEARRPQPFTIVYLQEPLEQTDGSSGCLALLILVGVILIAITLG